MKKIIIFFVFIFSYCAAYAQFDTSRTGTPYDLKGVWVTVSADTFNAKGYQNDTIRGLIRGGLYLIRQMTNDGEWPIEYLIGGDTSNAQNAARLQRAINKSYVKTILVTSDTVKNFYLSANINLHGKGVKFLNGCQLKSVGGITIDSMKIGADYNANILSRNILLTNATTMDLYFSMKWMGAVGNGVTDDILPLQAAASVQNQNLFLPWGTYITSDSLVIHPTNHFNGSLGLIYTTTTNRPAIIIGPETFSTPLISTSTRRIYYINVARAVQSNWADSSSSSLSRSTGVYGRNLNKCDIYIMRAGGFTVGAYFVGKGSSGGFVHNEIHPGQFTNNWVHMQYTRENSGWCNSNNTYGGTFSGHTGVNTTLARWGVWIGTPGDTYAHNNNNFYGLKFELSYTGYPIRVCSGYANHFLWYRDEGNTTQSVLYETTSRDNTATSGYSSTNAKKVDSSTVGNNQFQNPKDEVRSGVDAYTVVHWSAKSTTSGYTSTNVNVKGIGIFNSSGVAVSNVANSALGIYPEFVQIKSSGAQIGLLVDVSITKEFLFKPSIADGMSGRLLVTMYDSTGAQITTKGPQIDNSSPFYTASYGGGWITGANSETDFMIGLPEECKRAKITIVRATTDVRVKSFSLSVQAPSEGRVNYSFGDGLVMDNNVSTAIPTWYGTYTYNQIIQRAVPNPDSSWGWVCDSSGTNRLLTGAAGTITAGSNKLYPIGIDVDTVFVGEWIKFDGNKYMITRKSYNDTLYLSANAPSTYSGTFDYAPAHFVRMGGGSAIGTGTVTRVSADSAAWLIYNNITDTGTIRIDTVKVKAAMQRVIDAQPQDTVFIKNTGETILGGVPLLSVSVNQDTIKAKTPVGDGITMDIASTDTTAVFSARYTRGRLTTNGNSVLTTFTITHGLGATPVSVGVTMGHSDCFIPYIVNNYTGTTFDVVFQTAPATNTNNVIINWQAYK